MTPKMAPIKPVWEVSWLGRRSYQEGLALQEQLLQELIDSRRVPAELLSPQAQKNTLLLLEHEPVYTIGRTPNQKSLFSEQSEKKGEAFFLPHPLYQVGRGGEATYHGPGQLTVYPIFHLDLMGRDLHRYLRFLEEVILETLRFYGVEGRRRDGLTGVWVEDRKIASLGVGVRKWVAYHGLALNLGEDLSGFNEITPCGLSGVKMTSLFLERHHLGMQDLTLSVEEVGRQLADFFLQQLEKVA